VVQTRTPEKYRLDTKLSEELESFSRLHQIIYEHKIKKLMKNKEYEDTDI